MDAGLHALLRRYLPGRLPGNELFVSRSNTVNSAFLEIFALYRLLALKGSLLPALDIAYAGEAENAMAVVPPYWTARSLRVLL